MDPKNKKVTIMLPEDMARQLKAKAAMEGTTVTDVIKTLISAYLKMGDS